ncbi:zinc-ribbon domain-containing protein [bacterium]|nr:zinc-ribbon domain-containing protein [bacterium]
MIVRCPSCKTVCKIDDSRITLKGVKIRCPKCQYIFSVKKQEETEQAQEIRVDNQANIPAMMKDETSPAFYQERKQKRILIAEDTAFFRKMLADLLTKEGYEVLMAEDGEAALQMLKHELPALDLLILDLQLPKMDGFELLKQVRAAKLSQNLPVLVMTGVFKKAEEVMLVRKLGASGYISKSNPPDHFLFRINQILFPE